MAELARLPPTDGTRSDSTTRKRQLATAADEHEKTDENTTDGWDERRQTDYGKSS